MIVRDDDILGGEPRIEGTRVGVRHVVDRVIDAGRPPATVAEHLGVTVADVRDALSYYESHDDEIRAADGANAAALERLRDDALHPKESAR